MIFLFDISQILESHATKVMNVANSNPWSVSL